MRQLQTGNCAIETGNITTSAFEKLLEERYGASRKIILVDENTHDYCLEYLITSFPVLQEAEIMLLPTGEENKVMEVCFQVWEALSEYRIVRSDVVINLGGGVVTDMGGFIASLYKRGIDFINIPTTLLGMVDAAIGGKTGIDLGPYKNQLGVFRDPVAVFIDPGFLRSLPEEELIAGYAEMLKHALIADAGLWKQLQHTDPVMLPENPLCEELITRSVAIKVGVVNADPRESGIRKSLNFGHTIGHALEGYFLDKAPVAHGHAVGIGMLAESYISFKRGFISQSELLDITNYLAQVYDPVYVPEDGKQEVLQLLKHDKKNTQHAIGCVLLSGIGSCRYDETITEEEGYEALLYVEKVYTSN